MLTIVKSSHRPIAAATAMRIGPIRSSIAR
jgi:hypothetical protein